MHALIVVDIQNDFLPGGSLAVNRGNEVIPTINRLVKMPFSTIVATKDWHPANHISFASRHGKHPGEHIEVNGTDQILWPDHCVQGTTGSCFAPELATDKFTRIFYKGSDKEIDSYSTFFNKQSSPTGLDAYLKEKGIKRVYLAGLTTEYCVKYSALDAINLDYEVFVIEDACKGVNLNPEDEKNALAEMQREGVQLIKSNEIEL